MRVAPSRAALAGAIAAALAATVAAAADGDGGQGSTTLNTVQVTAVLDRSRDQLAPDLGVSQYVLDRQSLTQLPLGEATPLNQALLQAPGVAQDSFGQLHVRGDHGDLQYRIDGIVIPQSISGFGETLDLRLVERMQLLTGALPAQYGYHTAGVVELTTRPVPAEGGGSAGLTAGSFGTFNPEVTLFGRRDRWSFFFTGNFLENDVGIENPTRSRTPLHDHTDQTKGFGYLTFAPNEDTRLSFLFGSADNRFEIPDTPGLPPRYTLADVAGFDSATLDERQRERTAFGVLAAQGRIGATQYQVSLGQRYASVRYRPDPVGDLVFDGVAGTIDRSNRAGTLQTDFATELGNAHTLRYGLYASDERPVSDDLARVFPADAAGQQTSNVPIVVVDETPRITVRTRGAYLQDEWDLSDRLTLDYGLRADRVHAYLDEGQWSPRLALVYQASERTALHAGYARYFTPPPSERIAPADIARFQGTTNQLPSDGNAAVRSERTHYFDVGVTRKLGDGLTLGLDAYYRKVRDLLDEGQFGAALVFAPFNYARGQARGVEFSANYTNGNFSAYFNSAVSRALGRAIVTGQYHFAPDELAYLASHWVHLDHDQRLTGSGGVAWDWRGVTLGADFLCGSGLRRGFANTDHEPGYCQINAAATRELDLPGLGRLHTRLALINLADRVYPIRDGSGIGVGAPQFGPRRGVYLGVTREF